MPDDPRLFMRLPPEAAEDLYEAFRDQLEGAPGYVDPQGPHQLPDVRKLSDRDLEKAWAQALRAMRCPVARSHDSSTRGLNVGGGIRGTAPPARMSYDEAMAQHQRDVRYSPWRW